MIGTYRNLFMANMTLAEFIDTEMKRREMGVREFAEFIGVSHSVISKHANGKNVKPSIDFLVKLADKTETNLQAIFALVWPAVAKRTALSPRATILAQRLDNLSEPAQDVILAFVLSQK
jgi:transcriptional regulator with XRE-family HTH domain